jgi:hypothetical protein
MSVRCAPLLSHLDEPGLKPLNSACYMWWDLLRSVIDPPVASATESKALRNEVLAVLRHILTASHDACRESALHGLGHCASSDREAVELIIDDFLTAPDLRPELKTYAERAKAGRVP